MATSAFVFKPRPRSSKYRRLVTPLMILLVALPVVYWGASRDRDRREQVRQYLFTLCQAAGNRTLRAGDVNSPSSLIQTQVSARLLALTTRNWDELSKNLVISIAHGDAGPDRDRRPSYIALISIQSSPLLELSVEFDSSASRVVITGVSDPVSDVN